MAGGKETARQKMINIMYLVLLAMLALNVSDKILEAFKVLNDSLETAKTNVGTSVDQLFLSFEKTKLKDEPERAKPIYERAKQARAAGEELNDYVEKIKKEFATAGGGYDPESGDLVERANLDIAVGRMINQGEGEKLKKKINETRQKLIAMLDPQDRANVSFSLEAKDPEKPGADKKTWEDINFGEGTPLTAAMTILTKIQADVKNAESEVVKKIFGKMDQAVVTLDQFAAVAVAPTSYVIQGQPYTAEVFLTAYDSKSNPSISVNGSPLSVKDGKGTYTANNGEGMYTWVGTVRVKGTDGSIKTYTTPPQKYQVARPSATVSADKMNVFYIGVDNPVSVSAPGVPKESLSVSMSNGRISGSNGKYTVRVSSPGDAMVNVSANVNGKTQNVGSMKFRVKRIPNPVAKFAGKTSGKMASAIIRGQDYIAAVLENFDFAAEFKVTRYTLIIAKPRADAVILSGSGNALSGPVKSALNSVSPGTSVIFTDIIAVGPDGSQRGLDAIALTAN
ncbi:MAG: gldM [Sphingobacteriaceae bacterium]|jgi:gliding motility-associated protein GldM|nr:gldM [Sphingobacteriaceae bacterium]